ncbi:MAG: AAA family ATPase, partial [Deltaproteobacteria bacterium]|nr:AAA family ATPase [Deltaproteobacteria bacterium]
MPLSISNFAKVISSGGTYVDKTDFLAKIIQRGGNAFYFSRPRRFGKTLTVSTLEYLFSGRRDLFKGLAIEKHLDEEKFAPRPVLRLDMSLIKTDAGLPEFRVSLANHTKLRARLLGVELPSDYSADFALYDLIVTLGEKSSNGIAVLIDEYDAPLVNFLNQPDLCETLRKIMHT